MKTSNKLFELIKSMSMTEKIYFKKYTSVNAKGDEKNYIVLFDAFANLEEYDEVKLKQSLKKSPVLKYFSSSQAYLYKLILKCLRAYHSDESPSTQILELLLNSLFLKNRGLIHDSNKMLENATELADENGEMILFLKAFELRERNFFFMRNVDESEFLDNTLYPAMFEYLNKIKEMVEINRFMKIASELHFKYGQETSDITARTSVLKILEEPLLGPRREYFSKDALYRVFTLKNLIYLILGDYKSFWNNNESYLSTLENDPLFDKNIVQRKNYGSLLCNKMIVCTTLGKTEEMEATFNKIQSIQTESVQQEINFFIHSYVNITSAFGIFGLIEKGLAIIPEIIKKLKKYEGKMPTDGVYSLQFNISMIYFMAGDYTNSLKWINKILNNPNKDIRDEIFLDAKFLNILIHYELGNFLLIDNLIISLQRLLMKLKEFDDYSKTVLKYMKKLTFIMDKKEIQEELTLFKKDLEAANKNKRDKRPFVLQWIKKKLENGVTK